MEKTTLYREFQKSCSDPVYDLFDRSLLIKAKYDEDLTEHMKSKKNFRIQETEV